MAGEEAVGFWALRGERRGVLVVGCPGHDGGRAALLVGGASWSGSEEPAKKCRGRSLTVCEVRGGARAGEQEKDCCDRKKGEFHDGCADSAAFSLADFATKRQYSARIWPEKRSWSRDGTIVRTVVLYKEKAKSR